MVGMREGTVIVIIGLILAGVSIAVLLKTTILRYKLGDRGYKAVLTVIIIIAALLCSTLIIGAGYDIRAISYQLMESRTMDPRWVAQLKQELVFKRDTFYIAGIIGCMLLGMYFLLYKSIRKVADVQQAQAVKNRWDWNKVNK